MNLCAAGCFVKNKYQDVGDCCLNLILSICFLFHVCDSFFSYLGKWVFLGLVLIFSSIILTVIRPRRSLFALTISNILICEFSLHSSEIPSLCILCFRNPLPAFFCVLAELKMHLLPVADCEWGTIDIMRGSKQHKCMCELAAATHIFSVLQAYFYHSIANALSLIQNASYPQNDRLSLWAGKNRSTMGSRCFFSVFSSWECAAAFCKFKCVFLSVCIHLCVCECVRGCAHECLRVCVRVSTVDWCLRTAHIFCLNAVSSACAPFIQVWQIKSCFSSLRCIVLNTKVHNAQRRHPLPYPTVMSEQQTA